MRIYTRLFDETTLFNAFPNIFTAEDLADLRQFIKRSNNVIETQFPDNRESQHYNGYIFLKRLSEDYQQKALYSLAQGAIPSEVLSIIHEFLHILHSQKRPIKRVIDLVRGKFTILRDSDIALREAHSYKAESELLSKNFDNDSIAQHLKGTEDLDDTDLSKRFCSEIDKLRALGRSHGQISRLVRESIEQSTDLLIGSIDDLLTDSAISNDELKERVRAYKTETATNLLKLKKITQEEILKHSR